VRSVAFSWGSSIEQGDNGVTLMTRGGREDPRHYPDAIWRSWGIMRVGGRLNTQV
jgi:hypothetical protein